MWAWGGIREDLSLRPRVTRKAKLRTTRKKRAKKEKKEIGSVESKINNKISPLINLERCKI